MSEDVDRLVNEARPLSEIELVPGDPHVAIIESLERKIGKLKSDVRRGNTLYQELQKKYDAISAATDLVESAGPPKIFAIEPKSKSKSKTEAAVVLVASDWHVEEVVDPQTVNYLNEYDVSISEARAKEFFTSALRLIEHTQNEVAVNTVILALLGDFITNDIHEELPEVNELLPMEAIMAAQSYIASGIAFLLERTKCKIVVPCHSGNHGRTTKRIHVSTEHGHSLEYFMYRNLERQFSSEKRVQFQIARSYHSYCEVFDTTVRFHHGNGVTYYGGVGGIYIPVNKAIAQWNKAHHADLDIFGHFHQLRDGHNFLSNGSLIGYNAYGVRIKAEYEPPRQAFTVIDNKHGRTITRPIFVEKRRQR